MHVEGSARRSPRSLTVMLPRENALLLERSAISQSRKYTNAGTPYDRGLMDAGEIPFFVGSTYQSFERGAVIGKVCEGAVVKWLMDHGIRCQTDILALSRQGDGGRDILVNGNAWIQVKARSTDRYHRMLVKHGTEGRADYFVQTRWTGGRPGERFALVDLIGWRHREFVVSCPVMPAIRGTHNNREVNESQLLEMPGMIRELRL